MIDKRTGFPLADAAPWNPAERDLVSAIENMESVGNSLDPADAQEWTRYVEALQRVNLANWKATTGLSTKFSIIKSVLNEVK